MPVVPHWVWGGAISLTCGFAAWKGRAPERWGALFFYGAWLLTIAVYNPKGLATQWAIFGVDTVLLALLTALALRSDRFWPLFMAAFQLLTVLTHVGRALDSGLPWWAYHTAPQIWGYLMILSLLVGTLNTWRERRQFAAAAPMADPGATRR